MSILLRIESLLPRKLSHKIQLKLGYSGDYRDMRKKFGFIACYPLFAGIITTVAAAFFYSIQNVIYSIKAKRVVIDSISILELYFEDKFKTRRNILDLAKTLRQMGITTLAVAEVDDQTGGISREGVEEFVADGVIMLFLDKKNNTFNRAISVRKMRATNHSLKIHPLKIKRPGGIIVYPFEETFNEF